MSYSVKRALCRQNRGGIDFERRAAERGRPKARFLENQHGGCNILCAKYLQNMYETLVVATTEGV